jgi:GntR family transcriptional regulator
MRLWLSKTSEVPAREQLATQIMLGVVSGDFAPGEKLPSTRELARRLRIHANTVSAAFQDLEERGWLEARRGSGVYVRETPPGHAPDAPLDQLIATFFRMARADGHSLTDIRARLRHWLQLQPPDHFLVIEPNPELRALLVAEITAATGATARGASLDDLETHLVGAAPVALYDEAANVRAALPPDKELLLLRSRSVAEEMAGQRRPDADEIVTVVSAWPDFLRWARTMLVAAGLSPDALLLRDAREENWQRGLRASAMVITESLTAGKIPAGCDVRVFRLVADASLEELRQYAAQMDTRYQIPDTKK